MNPQLGSSSPAVPPLYQSSVYSIPDLDAIDRIYDGQAPGYIYARDRHPNARMLAEEIARLESAGWALVCSSGMAALTAALVGILKQGEQILAGNRLYGRSTQLLTQELPRFGVSCRVIDANDLDQARAALESRPRLLVVETLSNPLLRLADVPALAELCRARQCLLLVDNTFATPTLLRPLELGADLVLESITKMMGGHGDVTLGALGGGPPELCQRLEQVVSCWGLASSPFECWLAARGLGTLSLRMLAACGRAAELADWLAASPAVSRVVYPGRPDHPDHERARRLLGGRFGNMLCFELQGGREAVNRFMRHAPGIPFCPSLGHTQTTCSHPAATSHRFASEEERRRQGITPGLIRLSVGIEPIELLREEMARGLAAASA